LKAEAGDRTFYVRADLWIWSLEFEFGVWIVAIGGLGDWSIGVLEYWGLGIGERIGDWRV
jgi:hypothetical protein